MKVVYFGSGAFGLPTLESVASRRELRAIVTQPDRPAGRSRKSAPTPVGLWASEHAPGVPIFKPQDVNDPGFVRELRENAADAWIVIAYGQKLGRELLRDRFAINLHASLLPRWRGAAPINHAILAGDARTGNSVITLADRMDAGLILGQSSRPIDPSQTAGELHDALAADGPALVERVLREHETGALTPRAQDESLVTIAGKLSKRDGWVDFTEPARACRRRIHGLNPWPGVAATLGGATVKLRRVQPDAAESDQLPGTILDPVHGIVACGGATALRLVMVQPAGGRAMPWPDFARGRPVARGDRIESDKPC